MNAWMRLFCFSLIVTLAASAYGEDSADLSTAADLKSALHDLLSHGDLFDPVYVSERLGIGLHVRRPESSESDSTRTVAFATSNPPLMRGDISYYVDSDSARNQSTARLSFTAKSCGSLRTWGSEWQVPAKFGMSTDGGPAFDSLVWPGVDGISLMMLNLRGAECQVSMQQTVQRLVSIPASSSARRISSNVLSAQIAAILLTDLRDFRQVGRILNTEFEAPEDAQRKGLLYFGAPTQNRILLGFEPYVFYSGNDSGWYMPAGFFARPLHIADRSVDLNLTVDNEVVCLSQVQLATDLKRFGHGIRGKHVDERDQSAYFSRSANLLSAFVQFEDGCAYKLGFFQVTDQARSLGDPIVFSLKRSLDPDSSSLTTDARRRIRLLASRLTGLKIGGIEISEIQGKQARAKITGELRELRQLIEAELKSVGVLARSQKNEYFYCGSRSRASDPGVCVDVWR